VKQGSLSQCEVPKEKEIESPRFQALLRMTGGPRKGKTPDIKSFSHELDPRGIRSHEFMRPHSLHELEVCATTASLFCKMCCNLLIIRKKDLECLVYLVIWTSEF
jgi:hypothetical protein